MEAAERIAKIAEHYRAIIELLGEDPEREGLKKTPVRAAKAMIYATSGYRQDAAEIVNDAIFEAPGKGLIVLKDIEFFSLCEHHILPFFGHISIGYIPNGKIIGLSKIARLVDVYAHRLQVQERLLEEVVDALADVLGCCDVIAEAKASHLCMKMRGVEKQDSTTVTIAKRGRFATDPALAQEFFNSL